MTVSYSLNVSKATFGGFAKLLFRWKGSIFKGLWRESVLFCTLYAAINATYRHALDQGQQTAFNEVVKFAKYFMEVIPFSFIVGFYVSTVTGRWINQFLEMPWPDKTIHLVSSFVHGSDERSRMIRRTLARYAVLLQILTYQTVSTAVRRRFPTTQHLVAAGIMTAEERSVFEKADFAFGKWWLPGHWFTTLATRARKEGRIQDSVLLKALIQEFFALRNQCAIMIGYDWMGVPLAYTQVATIATYLYALMLLVGTQSIETQVSFTADYYFPFITIWRFFFSVGWLKVGEALLNPYGEDDDDFELNWSMDRALSLAYHAVDTHYMMHPKVKKDAFWDVKDIRLPQTVLSAKYMKNPEVGSAVGLECEEADYLPMDELCEKDEAGNEYRNQSARKRDAERQNSSFIRRILHSKVAQSFRKKSRMKPPVGRSQSCVQGVCNEAFHMSEENGEDDLCASTSSTPHRSRKTSQINLVRKKSPVSKSNSTNFRPKSSLLKKQKSCRLEETAETYDDAPANDKPPEARDGTLVRTTSTPNSHPPGVTVDKEDLVEEKNESGDDFEANPEEPDLMPPIPEEAGSRADSLDEIVSVDFLQRVDGDQPQHHQTCDRPLDTASDQERWKKEAKDYDSCCTGDVSREGLSQGSSVEGCEKDRAVAPKLQDKRDVYVTIEQQQQSGQKDAFQSGGDLPDV